MIYILMVNDMTVYVSLNMEILNEKLMSWLGNGTIDVNNDDWHIEVLDLGITAEGMYLMNRKETEECME